MFGKLSVALLLATTPALALAGEAKSEIRVDANGQAFKIKKVCRTVEVAGSFIPRTSCVNKKVPIKKPEAEGHEAASSGSSGTSETEAGKAPEEQ